MTPPGTDTVISQLNSLATQRIWLLKLHNTYTHVDLENSGVRFSCFNMCMIINQYQKLNTENTRCLLINNDASWTPLLVDTSDLRVNSGSVVKHIDGRYNCHYGRLLSLDNPELLQKKQFFMVQDDEEPSVQPRGPFQKGFCHHNYLIGPREIWMKF